MHVVGDLTIASRQEADYKQNEADVVSFDAGYGSAYLAKMVGQKYAREIFVLGRTYSAERMQQMGAVNIEIGRASCRERGEIESADGAEEEEGEGNEHRQQGDKER